MSFHQHSIQTLASYLNPTTEGFAQHRVCLLQTTTLRVHEVYKFPLRFTLTQVICGGYRLNSGSLHRLCSVNNLLRTYTLKRKTKPGLHLIDQSLYQRRQTCTSKAEGWGFIKIWFNIKDKSYSTHMKTTSQVMLEWRSFIGLIMCYNNTRISHSSNQLT